MLVKRYGIYLAYPPTVDLRSEGLGRHLAEFLKGAQDRTDIRFVIACPSWMRSNVTELFEASRVRSDSFEIISPRRKPVLLSLHEYYVAFRNRPKRVGRLMRLWKKLKKLGSNLSADFEKRLTSTRNIFTFTIVGFFILPFFIVWMVNRAMESLSAFFSLLMWKIKAIPFLYKPIKQYGARVAALATQPKQDSLVNRLYRLMEEAEASLMRELIDARKDIAAWYSPTAFWPHFNDITAPRLICVPDVVLTDFPAGFSSVGGKRFLDTFMKVEKAIDGGQYFVTYSEDVKWRTLVDRYHVDPRVIHVVPHGSNRLDDLVSVSGLPDQEAATDALCRNLLKAAMLKAVDYEFVAMLGRNNLRFIFYASQFRPNKNLLSLLRAYDYLLKRRYVGHKLILTGDPNAMPEIRKFLEEKNLQNDVLCLRGLSAQELAACYRLADLAVNPSLSEGGCPFTFTEALSVGTPAMMARISVTEEVVTASDLRDLMLFDPFDWKNMAERIEWGLKNRELLLEKQRPFYEKIAQRTWRNVVDDYVEILDHISSQQKIF